MTSLSVTGASPVADGTVKLQREINLLHATAAMAGVMIGSGIFVSPISIISQCGSVGLSLIVWALAGALMLCVVLCYTELACMIPEAGGEYVFLLRSMGRLPAFLAVWAQFTILQPCFLAILSLTTINYVIYPAFPACDAFPAAKSILSILVLFAVAGINSVYVRYITRLQTIFMFLKMLALVLLIIGGLVHALRGYAHSSIYSFENTNANPGRIVVALISGIYTYGGWQYTFSLLEEVKNPEKVISKAVCLSLAIVTGLYLLTNVAYFAVMSPEDMMSSDAVAVTFASRVYGHGGAYLMPILVACSTMGALNGSLLGGTRKYFAAARDGLFPEVIAMLHVKYLTPWISIFSSAVIAVIYIAVGDAVVLIEYLGFVDVFSFAVTCFCVLYLRYSRPEAHRPFKIPISVALLSVLTPSAACILALYEKPYRNGIGILLVLSGIPVYVICVILRKPATYENAMGRLHVMVQKILLVLPEDHRRRQV